MVCTTWKSPSDDRAAFTLVPAPSQSFWVGKRMRMGWGSVWALLGLHHEVMVRLITGKGKGHSWEWKLWPNHTLYLPISCFIVMAVFACSADQCAPGIYVLVLSSPSLSFQSSWKSEHHVQEPKKAAMQGPILEATFKAQKPSDIKAKQNNPMWPSHIPNAQLLDVLLVTMHKCLRSPLGSRNVLCTSLTLQNMSLTYQTKGHTSKAWH